MVRLPDDVCAGKDQSVFRVRVGSHNSPLMHLVRVVETSDWLNQVKWQWWRPRNDAFAVPSTKKMTKEGCAAGFVLAGSRGATCEAWSSYDEEEMEEEDEDPIIGDGDILVSWDIESEEEAGKIAGLQYDMLIEKLKRVMKGKKKPRAA